MAAAEAPQPSSPARCWADAARVLAVRLDNLGDVLMTTPALAALKGGARHLTLLASPAGAALAPHLGGVVDQVIAFDAPWVRQADAHEATAAFAADVEAERRLLGRLAQARFDAAVIFTVCTQSALPAALLCRLAGIGLRLAISRENPYRLLTDRLPETDFIIGGSDRAVRHEVRRQLDLVAQVGCTTSDERLRFRCRAVDSASVHERLAAAGVDAGRPFIALHLGSSAASRRYPPERFAAAADEIAARARVPVVLLAGPHEQPLLARARAALRTTTRAIVLDAAPLALGELGALLAQAAVVVCNNSGPAHIAAAVGTPVVVLYALTNPQHAPWGVPARVLSHDVPCRNCLKSVCPEPHHGCLLGVAPAAVAAAALELLSQPRVATAPPAEPAVLPTA